MTTPQGLTPLTEAQCSKLAYDVEEYIYTGKEPGVALALQLFIKPLLATISALRTEAETAKAERDAARAALNVPEVIDFAQGVVSEAAHQRSRWGSAHDAGKLDADWFWLVGYLAGKALHNPPKSGEDDLALKQHRIIACAAALANWHAAISGRHTVTRPGINQSGVDDGN